MNRQRRLALLLSPLVITSLALAPAVAAQAATPGSAPAQKGGPFCALEEVGKKDNPRYDLVLEDFPRNARVSASGPEALPSKKVNGNGDHTFKDVEYGKYTVSYQQKGQERKVPCETPPPPKDGAGTVDLVDVDITKIDPPHTPPVDCKGPMQLVANGVIKAKGKGNVTYQWRTPGKTHPQQSVPFTGPEEPKPVTKEFTIPARPGAAGQDTEVSVTLIVIKPSQADAEQKLTFKCV